MLCINLRMTGLLIFWRVKRRRRRSHKAKNDPACCQANFAILRPTINSAHQFLKRLLIQIPQRQTRIQKDVPSYHTYAQFPPPCITTQRQAFTNINEFCTDSLILRYHRKSFNIIKHTQNQLAVHRIHKIMNDHWLKTFNSKYLVNLQKPIVASFPSRTNHRHRLKLRRIGYRHNGRAVRGRQNQFT